MAFLDSVVKLVGGDLTPGFNLPSANYNFSPSTGQVAPFSSFSSSPQSTTQPTAPSGGGIPAYGAGNKDEFGGTTLGVSSGAPTTDPYAQWGGQGAYNNLVNQFNTQRQGINNSATDWASNYGTGLGGNITDYIAQLKQGQQGLDERGVQNELALKQGRAGILDMIARGIRSGGVTLANRNASDSSAAGALANAYGDMGNRQAANVGNQYALENRNIGLDQANFTTNAQLGANKIKRGETQDIAGAVQNAQQQLASLDAWAAGKSLPERIQVEQEKAKIQAQIEAALGQYGTQLDQGVAGVAPTSAEQNRTTALGLSQAGTAAVNPFDFTSAIPTQFQNTGGVPSNLPLFTTPRRKTA